MPTTDDHHQDQPKDMARLRFSLPLRPNYIVPARCSSCDVDLPQPRHQYALRLTDGSQIEAPLLVLPLCDHCRLRRGLDRIGAAVGLAFGAFAAALSYGMLRQLGLLLAVPAVVVLLFGVAVAFSILWAPLCDRIWGEPRFAAVLFSLPRGATRIEFDFHNPAYGQRFRAANMALDDDGP